MTDSTIPPVFDAEKWQRVLAYQQLARERGLDPCAIVTHEPPAGVMAIANAALADDDPRKVTREMVDGMRTTAQGLVVLIDLDKDYPVDRSEFLRRIAERQLAFADDLASSLPPDVPENA